MVSAVRPDTPFSKLNQIWSTGITWQVCFCAESRRLAETSQYWKRMSWYRRKSKRQCSASPDLCPRAHQSCALEDISHRQCPLKPCPALYVLFCTLTITCSQCLGKWSRKAFRIPAIDLRWLCLKLDYYGMDMSPDASTICRRLTVGNDANRWVKCSLVRTYLRRRMQCELGRVIKVS